MEKPHRNPASKKEQTVRVLFAPLGTLGDVLPCLALALERAASGDHVSICVTRDFTSLCRSHGLRVIELPLDFTALASKNGPVMGKTLAALARFRANLKAADQAAAALLAETIPSYDLVIASGLQLWAFSPCEAAGIPHSLLYASRVWLPSSEYPPPFCPVRKKPHAPLGAVLYRLNNRLLWVLFTAFFNSSAGPLVNRQRRQLALSSIFRVYQRLLSQAEPVPPQAASPDTLIPSTAEDENRLKQFLTAGSPPVYCGFGSMPADPSRPVTALIVTVLRNLGQRVILQPHPVDRGLTAFIADQDVLIIGPFPHSRIFPYCRLIIHHGGAGTSEAALRSGVPQLVIPHILDQFSQAAHIATESKGSSVLPLNRVSTDHLYLLLKSLLPQGDFNADSI